MRLRWSHVLIDHLDGEMYPHSFCMTIRLLPCNCSVCCKRLCVQFLKFGTATCSISCWFKMPEARSPLRATPVTLYAFLPQTCCCAVLIYLSTAKSQFWALLFRPCDIHQLSLLGVAVLDRTCRSLTLNLSGAKIVWAVLLPYHSHLIVCEQGVSLRI